MDAKRPDVIELSKSNGNSLKGCNIWNRKRCRDFCRIKLFSSYISEVVRADVRAGSNRCKRCSLRQRQIKSWYFSSQPKFVEFLVISSIKWQYSRQISTRLSSLLLVSLPPIVASVSAIEHCSNSSLHFTKNLKHSKIS